MIIFLLSIAMACPSDFETYCRATCDINIDKAYWVKDGVCYCGNPVTVKMRLPANFKGKAVITQQPRWSPND